MGRKLEMMGRKVVDVLEKVDILQHDDLPLGTNQDASERLLFTGPADWSPDQAEQYIDWRIQLVDAHVAKLRQQLDDLTAMRRRWLAVTGGRSKVFGTGNGSGNGSSNGSSNGSGNGSGNGNGNGNGNGHDDVL
ncbi:MAG TPA: hypothetical protein VN955_02830 [Gemmatimonadales bacterium]|nr:hypothetical protein [Gemmatimonadales bacterium]